MNKRKLNYFLNFIKVYFKYGLLGNKIRMEAASVCQLRCPSCPTGKGNNGVIGSGYLKFEDFKNFVLKYPEFKVYELANYGEIFLNPDLGEICKFSYENGIRLSASTGVNFNTVTDEILEVMVKYKFIVLNTSIDGASQETYSIYRKRGDFNKVIRNIKKINEYKKKYNSKFPILNWKFIVFGHNEHEIDKARDMAKDLEMSFNVRRNSVPWYAPIKNNEIVDKQFQRNKHDFGNIIDVEESLAPYCDQLWIVPQINFNGDLLGCCVNRQMAFGNVFKDGLKESLKGKKFVDLKNTILGRRLPSFK